jgi:hypothetical protein
MEILDEVHQSSLMNPLEHCLEQGFFKEMLNIAQVAIINVNPMHLW